MISYQEIENMYFQNRDQYFEVLKCNKAYKYLSFAKTICILLHSMQQTTLLLKGNYSNEITIINSNDDPKKWRSQDTFKYTYLNIKYVLDFLGMNQSQIDVSRRIKKHLVDELLFTETEYESIQKKHLDGVETEFINNFRNYLQHYSVPQMYWQITKDFDTATQKDNLVIDTEELISGNTSCFKSRIKSWLKTTKQIDILKVIDTSADRLISFYSELFCLIMEKIENEMKEYLFIIECKNQMVKQIRKEKYTQIDLEIKELSLQEYKKIYEYFEKMNNQLFALLYESYSLVSYLRVST